MRDIGTRTGVRISLHLTAPDGRRLPVGDPLHDMKLRTALRRLGIDAAVIAGTAPATLPPPAGHAETLKGLAALADYATTRIGTPVTTAEERRDRTRRTLSVACSAARLVAVTVDADADTSLRLPAVAVLLAHHHPGAPIHDLLLAYDAYRRAGARSLTEAERLADQVPHALRDLLDRQPAPMV